MSAPPELRVGNTVDVPSALFQVDGDATRGALPWPRVTTTQRNAISAPADGLTVYDTTLHVLYVYQNGAWVALGSSGGAAPADATYITQTPSSGLSAEQALSLLSSGFMFTTTATGVVTSIGFTGSGNVVRATSPTIVTPTIADFTNATHNHSNAAGGGTLALAGKMTLTLAASASTVGAGFTRYGSPGGTSVAGTTETNNRALMTVAGTLKNLYVQTNTTQSAGGALVITLLVGGVASTVEVSIAASTAAGNFSDTTHTVAVNAGDGVSVRVVNNGSGTSAALLTLTFELDYTVT